MNVSNIRVLMQHNNFFKMFVPYFRRSAIVRLIHTFEGYYSAKKRKKEIAEFLDCYENNKDEYEKVFNLLYDEESKKTYEAVLKFRGSYDYSDIKKYITYPQYFVKDIFIKYEENEVFVDGGAYTGDTIYSMLKNMYPVLPKKIYAWEPDQGNGITLKREADKVLSKYNGSTEVKWIPCVLYKEESFINFNSTADGVSKIEETGMSSIKADTIDNLCSDATFIKMDIEGGEIDALYGAKNTIIKNKPKLAICIYHTNSHLFEIPLLINQWVPEYKIYIRHHGQMEAETVMYAVL